MRRTPILLLALACTEPTAIDVVAPKLEVDRSPIELPPTPLRATRHVALTVRNGGSAPLRIEALEVAAPFFARAPADPLGPGASVDLDLAYRPEVLGRAEALVRLRTDGGAAEIPIAGFALDGFVAVNPERVDLGEVSLGAGATRTLSVVNYADETLHGRWRALGFERPAHFAGGPFDGAAALAVEPRRDHSFDLAYAPIALGADAGELLFEYCGDRCGAAVDVSATAVASALRLAPPAVDFGEVEVGTPRRSFATIANQGNRPVEILELRVDGTPDARASIAERLPHLLAGGEVLTVSIDYTAGSVGPMRGWVVVRSTDPGNPEARIALGATGAGAVLHAQPEVVDFGVVLDAGPHRRPLILINAGSTPIQIDSAQVEGASALSLVDAGRLPARLFAGESLILDVQYAPTAVGAAEATVRVATDHPDFESVAIPVRAGYAERACQLDRAVRAVQFGVVAPSLTRRRTVSLRNVGRHPCTLLSGALADPSETAFTIDGLAFPLSLAVGASHDFAVEFSPAARRQYKTSYLLTTDDPVLPTQRIQLLATALPDAQVFAQPELLEFAPPTAACPNATRTTRLYNTGAVPVVIERIELDGPAGVFEVAPLALPRTIAAGAELPLDVRVIAPRPTTARAWIDVHLVGRPFPVTVLARSTDAVTGRVSDLFAQRNPSRGARVDVLFAISNNCIMQTRQRQLADNVEAFIRSARASDADFRVGVTTTAMEGADAAIGGRLAGPVLAPTTPNFAQAFRAQALMGGTGRHFDKGMQVLTRTLEKAEAGEPGNVELFRPGSRRVLFVISNEDDYSPEAPAVYKAAFDRRSERHDVVLIIAATTPSCPYRSGTPRYQEFGRVTGASVEDICAADWSLTMDRLGSDVFGIRTRFPLSQQAQPGSIEVHVNGAPVLSGWAFDAVSNTVRFDAGREPAAGAAIEIRYARRCL